MTCLTEAEQKEKRAKSHQESTQAEAERKGKAIESTEVLGHQMK